MNCIKCNAPNAPEARFCKNCGTNLVPAQPDAKSDNYTITALLVIIGVEYGLSLIMFFLNKFFIPVVLDNGGTDLVSLTYNTFGWVSDIITLAVILFFLVNVKNDKVKTALVIFLILRFIFIIGYRAMPLFNL